MLRARTATLKRAFVLVRVGCRYFPHEKPQMPRYWRNFSGAFSQHNAAEIYGLLVEVVN